MGNLVIRLEVESRCRLFLKINGGKKQNLALNFSILPLNLKTELHPKMEDDFSDFQYFEAESLNSNFEKTS